MSKTCPYCHDNFDGGRAFGAHKTNCLKNPQRSLTRQRIKNSLQKRTIRQFHCACGKEFELLLTDHELERQKFRTHCGLSCANRRLHTSETKQKISRANTRGQSIKKPNHTCKHCHAPFFSYKEQQFCSRSCMNNSSAYREKLSQNKVNDNNPMFGRPPQFRSKIVVFSNKLQQEIRVRSSYEKRAIEILDSQSNVMSFSYEKTKVPYVLNGKTKNTIVDFTVVTDNGILLIEVKPQDMIKLWNNQVKIDAIRDFSSINGLRFELWTEHELRM